MHEFIESANGIDDLRSQKIVELLVNDYRSAQVIVEDSKFNGLADVVVKDPL